MARRGGSSSSIQKLLQAENEAKEAIATAKQNKHQMLKKARNDADIEVQAYREARQAKFEEFRKQHEGDVGSTEVSLRGKTEKTIQEVIRQTNSKKEEVIKLILDTIADVRVDFDVKQ